MSLAISDTKLSDIIVNEPNVVAVLSRFGIHLGVGDRTVEDACRTHALDTDFVLLISNTFVHENYFPETVLKAVNIADIVSYLDKTNDYYTRFLVPNIERHFNLLISKSVTPNNLQLMMQFFEQLKDELSQRITHDREVLFPQLINSASSAPDDAIALIDEPNSIEEKLGDLKNLFIIHLRGEYDSNLSHAVLLAIVNLEKDFKQNERIRQRILTPYAHSLVKK